MSFDYENKLQNKVVKFLKKACCGFVRDNIKSINHFEENYHFNTIESYKSWTNVIFHFLGPSIIFSKIL